jgi:hypothetical protein
VDMGKADIHPRWVCPTLAVVLAAAVLMMAANGGTYAVIPRGESFVIIWWTLTLGLTFGLLPRGRPAVGALVAIWALVGLAAWMLIGLAWTESAERTVIEVTRVLGLLGVVLVITLTFTARDWRWAAGAVAVAATALCMVALASRLAPDLLPSPLRSTAFARRLAYPINYWNGLGAWAAMTVGFGLAWSAHAPRWWLRGAALGAMCVAGSVAYLTYSRSAAANVGVAVVLVIVLSRHRWLAAGHALLAAGGTATIIVAIRAHPEIARGTGGLGGETVALVAALVVVNGMLAALLTWRAGIEGLRAPSRVARTAVAVLAAAALLAAVVLGPAAARSAWRSFERPDPALSADPAQRLATLGGTRRFLWDAALRAFERDPLRGTGAGTFEFVENRDEHRTSFVRDAHSLYLESLGELGLPGALLVVVALGGLLVAGLATALRQVDAVGAGAAAGCVTALVVFCITAGVDWMWESTAVAVLALTSGSLLATARAAPARRRPVVRRAVAGIVAFVALVAQVPVLTAAVEIRSSERAIAAGDIRQAVAAATTAVQVAPWGASGYLQRALALERVRLTRPAAADARRAVERESTNWKPWLVLARIEAQRGRVNAAVRAARRAAALNPNSSLFRPPAPRRR